MIHTEPSRAAVPSDSTERVQALADAAASRAFRRAGAPASGRADASITSAGLDPALADLAEELTARLQAGEPFDADAYEAEHPQWAGQIRGLLPVLTEMVGFARSVAAGPGGGLAGALQDSASGERIVGDFRIVREVGRGGMGIVYEAEQRSLGRRVALKVLPLAAAMDPRALQRFQLEAQATAWLQHPQIVPVYAVGVLGEVPFYTMQFIEGASLAELIAELQRTEADETQAPASSTHSTGITALARGLLAGRFEPVSQDDEGKTADGPEPTASERVDAPAQAVPTPDDEVPTRGREYARAVACLGVQAAEALDFAHRQGILHRDVKPANLLLDRRGALWVTDFGLARLSGDGGLTLTGDVVGTLRYMSPEQALAQHALIDRRTDIYSLGATLYELLTLRPIVSGGDRQEILRVMLEEEPIPIRRWNPAVPVDLATIVTKAISKDPARRYDSAQLLADDLKRFLDGRPIAARRSGPVRRVWRWCQRKPLPAGLAAALAIAVVAGFVGVTLSWREAVRRRDQLTNAQQETLAALVRESRANRALTIANIHERNARELAQLRFNLARDAVEQYYTGASEEVLLRQPAMSGLRKRLLGTALSFYQRLQTTNEQDAGDSSTQAELAAIYRRVGQIAVEIGARQDGLEALERTRAILERLVAANPSSTTLRRDLASCIEFLGRLKVYTSGQEPEGLRSLEQALALYETLLAEHPENAGDRFLLACAIGEIGYERARSGQVREGLASLEHERGILQEFVDAHPDSTLYRNQLALTYGEIGRIQAAAGALAAALRAHREAAGHLERLTGDDPTNGLLRRRLGQVETDTARILADAGRCDEALPHIERSLAILERLALESPAVDSFQRAVAEGCDILGATEARSGHPERALESLRRARATLARLTADNPDFYAYQADLAENHHWTGAIYQTIGRPADALAELSLARTLLQQAPLGIQSAYALARTESLLTDVTPEAERRGQSDRAMTALRHAVARGYRALEVLQTDPCLNPLRARPDFRMLVRDVQFPSDPLHP